MKNHIGNLESTALKPGPRGYAGQKKKLPTKKPPIHTFFVVFNTCRTPPRVGAKRVEVVNLPEMFMPEARL